MRYPGLGTPGTPMVGLGPLALTLLVLVGCSDVSVTEVEVASISISPEVSTIQADETVQLTAVARDAAGEPLGDRPVTWSSEDPEVARVDGSGLVLGQGPGVTGIRASVGGLSGTASVTVVQSPAIQLSSDEARFDAEAGDASTEPVSVEVTNGGEGTLSDLSVSIAFGEDGPTGWLEAELARPTAPTSLTLRARPGELPVGTHRAQVEVASGVASNSPEVLEAVLEVSLRSPSVVVEPGALGFASAQGQPPPGPQSVSVTNGGDGELAGLSVEVVYDPEQPEGWLDLELSDPEAPAEVTVTVDPSDLEPGVYDATLEVRSTSAPESVGEARIRFTLGEPPPEIGLDREAVTWSLMEGAGDPPPETVQIENLGSGTLGGLEASVRVAGGDLSGWLAASLAGTTAPTSLSLQVSAEDLVPGELEARVEVSSEDAVNSPQVVTVVVSVAPRPSAEHSTIDADPESILADGVSTSTITVQLMDPRGDPLTSGGHTVTLSSTSGTLSDVSDEGDGSYTASLTSGFLALGTAVVTGQVNGEDIDDSAEVTFTLLPASPETSSIEAGPSTIEADGASTSTITVRLRDAEGNPLPEGGDDVGLSASAGTLSTVSDEGDGTYSATLTSAASPGTAEVTGTVNGEAIDDAAEVEFTSGTPSAGETTAQVPAGTVDEPTTITITVRDANGHPVAGVGGGLAVSVSGGPNSGTSLAPLTDNGDGTYTTSYVPTEAGTDEITILLNGQAVSGSPFTSQVG